MTDAYKPPRYEPHLIFGGFHIFPSNLRRIAWSLSRKNDPVEHEDDDILTTSHFLSHFTDLNDSNSYDSNPKPMTDSWRLTPSFLDLNYFAFTPFANQFPGLYTLTRSGLNTLYHSQAGDLHTPEMGMHLGTPLSMPHTGQRLQWHDSGVEMQQFQPYLINHHPHFHNPFVQQQQQQPQRQSYAPSHFLQHHDSGYEAMEHSPHKPSLQQQQQQDKFMGEAFHTQSISGPVETIIPPTLMHGSEK